MPSVYGPVLVIDDDAAVRNSLKFALELEGLDVRLYEAAAHLLGEGAMPGTGCLVVDHRMPGLDGIALVEGLRGRQVALPAILIAARVTEDLRRRAAGAGFRLVLEKPLDDGSLLAGFHDALAEPLQGRSGVAT
ncbi:MULTISPECIES: response regulator transcription factor [Methylobacterium]|uniref:Response regulator receiver protein n=2 Tax=Methylobacterium TaxID=407 RepID=A0A089NS36_9HYPH|nr:MULTISPECIES: response regulator [Methylobacterium]ACB24568.1 response regulator receiver protein [Methylobacterium radiotolerans JCM 2831]AIQ90746.1 Response regulator receiver protein [Methylobacterium oryzae CBMB20]GEN00912.1 response regulator [Methylobacterium radiotolerans]